MNYEPSEYHWHICKLSHRKTVYSDININRMSAFCKVQKRPARFGCLEKCSPERKQLAKQECIQFLMCGDLKLQGTKQPSVAGVGQVALSGDKSVVISCHLQGGPASILNE